MLKQEHFFANTAKSLNFTKIRLFRQVEPKKFQIRSASQKEFHKNGSHEFRRKPMISKNFDENETFPRLKIDFNVIKWLINPFKIIIQCRLPVHWWAKPVKTQFHCGCCMRFCVRHLRANETCPFKKPLLTRYHTLQSHIDYSDENMMKEFTKKKIEMLIYICHISLPCTSRQMRICQNCLNIYSRVKQHSNTKKRLHFEYIFTQSQQRHLWLPRQI